MKPSCRKADSSLRRPSETCSNDEVPDRHERLHRVDQRLRGQRASTIPASGGAEERHPAVVDRRIRAGYGVAKSQRKDSNTQRLDAFFAGPLEWTLFDEDDARAAGTVRAELEAVGKPIGAYDLLLAGQARRRGATLVTSNAKEFARVPGLKWEDWARHAR